jgi:hypothetical protein
MRKLFMVATLGLIALSLPGQAQSWGYQSNGFGGYNGTGAAMGGGWQSNG